MYACFKLLLEVKMSPFAEAPEFSAPSGLYVFLFQLTHPLKTQLKNLPDVLDGVFTNENALLIK